MNKPFKLPPTRNTKPAIQILSTPASTQKSTWEHLFDSVNQARAFAMSERKVVEMSQQPKLRCGDLVEWSPMGVRGLWKVTDVSAWRDANDMGVVDFKSAYGKTTDAMANEMTDASDDQILADMGFKVTRHEVGRGKVRLEWFSGWDGYASDRMPVQVKIEEVRKLTAMEVLALASS